MVWSPATSPPSSVGAKSGAPARRTGSAPGIPTASATVKPLRDSWSPKTPSTRIAPPGVRCTKHPSSGSQGPGAVRDAQTIRSGN